MLFDMHVHSAEVSPCSTISAVDIVREYKNKGYDGIVLTDHFLKYYMEVSFKASFEEYCRLHHEGYLKAKEEGEKLGFAVLYGCELRLNSTGNSDYLLYGITHEFLAANPDIFTWKVNKLKEKADENGFFVYQAHPFRDVMVIANPANLTGMEVLNGKETDPLRSEFSELWADRYNLRKIAGSDCHHVSGVGVVGLDFDAEIRNNDDLLSALGSDNYHIVRKASENK